ncbi:MAG: DUF2213 domain-containing protein [Thiotrichales bacterium]|nr:DUF2213 domain-containing protein [Thiotrichales bacterium]
MKRNKMLKNLLALDDQVQIIEKKLNDNGYLVIRCIFARTGIQERYGAEINSDFEATKLYKEYRSPKEVFKPEVLKAFRNVVITNDHPQGLLTSSNTSSHSVGFVSSEVIVIDNTYLECEITIYDKGVIEDIQNGKVELSAGYLYSLLMVENEEYDYLQTDFKPNHIAIVQAGRCGLECSLAFDNQSKPNKGKSMKKIVFKRMMPDGSENIIATIEVSDESAVAVQGVADMIFKKSEAMVTASKATDEELTALKDDVKAKDEEIEEKTTALDKLQAQVDTHQQVGTDAKAVQALALDLAGVIVVAQDCAIDTTGKDIESIKKAVISKVQPDLALDGKSPEYIGYAFDNVASQLKGADASFLKAMQFTPVKGLDEKQKLANDAQTTFGKTYGGND